MSERIAVPKPSNVSIEFFLLTERDETYYFLNWPTKITDAQAFSEIRKFYEALRTNFGDNSREIHGKAYHGLTSFCRNGPSPEMSLEEFLNEAEFEQILRRQAPLGARISTPYGDFFYDMESSERQIIDGESVTQRYIAVMSHLDLSDLLPSLIFKTHRDKLTLEQEQQRLFELHLKTQLAKLWKIITY
mgnify:CR=1 FL=1